MKNYHLTISSPEGEVFNGDVISLSVRGEEGDLAVFAGHIPFITTLRPGRVEIVTPDEESQEGYLESGVLNVSSNSVRLLVGDKNFIGKKAPGTDETDK